MQIYNRHLTDILIEKTKKNGIITLIGPRQSGKTTLIKSILPKLTGLDTAYVSFDDPDQRLRFRNSTIPAMQRLKAPLILLDEVQKAPYVLDGVKYLFDKGETKQSTIILTGSAQILMLRQVQETLAGRTSMLELLPLSMAEINGTSAKECLIQTIWENSRFEHALASKLAFDNMDTIRAKEAVRDAVLAFGGYPPVVNAFDEAEKKDWINNYRKTYVERDVPDAGGVGDIEQFIKIQQLLALRTANLLSYSDVARDASCSPNTIRRYLHTMEITFQAFLLKPYHKNRGKRLIKSPKIFFADNGVLLNITRGGITPGALYETFIFSELLKWRAHNHIDMELLFYRTSAGMEVDFIIEGQGITIPIEVKNTAMVRNTDGRSLMRFLSEFPQTARFGLLVYKGKEVIELSPKIFAVPDFALFG